MWLDPRAPPREPYGPKPQSRQNHLSPPSPRPPTPCLSGSQALSFCLAEHEKDRGGYPEGEGPPLGKSAAPAPGRSQGETCSAAALGGDAYRARPHKLSILHSFLRSLEGALDYPLAKQALRDTSPLSKGARVASMPLVAGRAFASLSSRGRSISALAPSPSSPRAHPAPPWLFCGHLAAPRSLASLSLRAAGPSPGDIRPELSRSALRPCVESSRAISRATIAGELWTRLRARGAPSRGRHPARPRGAGVCWPVERPKRPKVAGELGPRDRGPRGGAHNAHNAHKAHKGCRRLVSCSRFPIYYGHYRAGLGANLTPWPQLGRLFFGSPPNEPTFRPPGGSHNAQNSQMRGAPL